MFITKTSVLTANNPLPPLVVMLEKLFPVNLFVTVVGIILYLLPDVRFINVLIDSITEPCLTLSIKCVPREFDGSMSSKISN